MMLAKRKLEEINSFLANDCKNLIDDYRIYFRSTSSIDILIKMAKNSENAADEVEIRFYDKFQLKTVSIEFISQEESDEDGFYKNIFSQSNKEKIIHARRRYERLFSAGDEEKNFQLPVVSFYSYKGGVGRTTTLFMFAMYLAIAHKKKVFLIDCDFEAPGLVNFIYSSDEEDQSPLKNGIVEYLVDSQFLGQDPENLSDYFYELSNEYSGDGKIYLMPAGNLSTSPVDFDSKQHHINHYLEALSRLNISNSEYILDQFKMLLTRVKKELDPDLILIDSRTGFNDVFANFGLGMSNIIVGFFFGNIQTDPGIFFFLDRALSGKNTDVVLVNSIISSRKVFEEFGTRIQSLIEKVSDTSLIDPGIVNNISQHPLYREQALELLGSGVDYIKELIASMKSNHHFGYHRDLFSDINEKINRCQNRSEEKKSPKNDERKKLNPYHKNESQDLILGSEQNVLLNTPELLNNPTTAYDLRNKILSDFIEACPESYAEDISIDAQTLKNRFYYRKCMEDIFNKSFFLLIGGKGTGKTFFYRMLSSDSEFLKVLQEKAQKKGNYCVVDIISLESDPANNRFGHVSLTEDFSIFSRQSDESDLYFFCRRFWIVYTWISIFLNSSKINNFGLDIQPSIDFLPTWKSIRIDRAKKIEEIIYSDDLFRSIENDLNNLNQELKRNDVILIITYDQLDRVVKPRLWSKGVAPLVNYWRNNFFSNIHPKIFLRTDLFNKMGNLTNKKNLESAQSIKLEWDEKELFGVFFKYVLSVSKSDFFKIMEFYSDFSKETIENVKSAINSDNQIINERKYIEPMVVTFFGEYVEIKSITIKTYEWFYKNLCNADKTISLRPFIDLMLNAIKNYFDGVSLPSNKYDKPILHYRNFSHYDVRKEAVKRHFSDLADEEGNRDLNMIYKYISMDAPASLRKSFLTKKEFEDLLYNVIKTYGNELEEHRTLDDLRELLIDNGIISTFFSPGGNINYVFAFLYKYYLGLSGKRKNYW